MLQFGGKDSKRHFTVVIDRGGKGGTNVPPKENGLYISSSPSSAARKAVTKLCTANKSKKVEFYIREITQGSKKKTYGPYSGHIEKLKQPIELKGRVIKYKPIAKLSGKKGVKKGGMFGRSQGGPTESICIHDRNNENGVETTALRYTPSPELIFAKDSNGKTILLIKNEQVKITRTEFNGEEKYYLVRKENDISGWVRAKYIKCLPKVRVQPPNINNSPKLLPSQLNNKSWSVGFQPKYKAGISGLQVPSASFSEFPGQSTRFSEFPGQSAYNQVPSARFSGFPGQSTRFSEFPGQSTRFSEFPGQSTRFSEFPGQSANLSANMLQTNRQDFKKLYNCLDNSQLLQSIGGSAIPGIYIPKLQVIDLLGEQTDLTGKNFGKIRVLTSQGYVEGFVPFDNLKKTRWCCNHNFCLKFNGPYDKDQLSNKTIPVSVAIILRNSQGEILVGTETDSRKMSEYNKSLPGYHLCAGKIDPGSCPINSSYDETAEESRFLPVVKDSRRDFDAWDAMFKPGGKYRIEPWVSSGRAIVFVGDISNKFWDDSSPPYGNQKKFTNPNQLDNVFDQLRKKLPETPENHKYKEKINFKWVTPLPFGSSKNDWDDWSNTNQMFDWGRKIIQDYVEKSSQPAQLQSRLPNFSRQPTFSRGMSASSAYVPNEKRFDDIIFQIIFNRMSLSETNLEDLLKLCSDTYFGMFQRQIPQEKLHELKKSIMKNPIRQNGPNPIFF
jgi:hypothetical protein